MKESRTRLPTSRLVMIGVGLAIVVIAGVLLFGRRRDPATERVLGYMRSDLQGLLIAEQTVRRATGKYLADPDSAGHLSTPGVNMPEVTLAGDGFVATVTHSTRPDLKCAVAVGTRNPLSRSASDGEIVCE